MMESLTLIIALSGVLWYLIDRFKPIWEGLSYGKWITTGCAALGAFALVFCFNLDILYALTLVPEITIAGQIITALALTSGSSAIAEIIERIKG